jgi:integrase/recombinase XerD
MATVYRRGKTWWVRFQWNGREIRQSARTTLKGEAREYLQRLQDHYRTLSTGGKPRATFDEAAVLYITEFLPAKTEATIASYQQSLRVLASEFGGKFLDQIDRKAIAAFEAKQAKRIGASKLKHYRAALSGVFKIAMRHDLAESNPCRTLDPITVNNARYRYLKPAEWKALRVALSEPHRSIAEISTVRGMRCGEVLQLRWEHVDFARDEISIYQTKNHFPRVIPLEDARPILERLKPKSRGLIFQSPSGLPLSVAEVTRKVNAVAREIGLENFTFHDLRHTYASWYVQAGGDLYRLQLLLGHKTPSMTQRYAHLSVDHLRRGAQKPAQDPRDFLH